MNVPAVTSFLYGALVLAGGWIGYKKASSRPSLLCGTIAGVLLFLAAFLSFRGNAAGDRIAMIVAFALALFFGYRLLRGGKFMPAGLMVAASLLVVVILYFCSLPRP